MRPLVLIILATAVAQGQTAPTLKAAYQGIFRIGAALNPAQFEERDPRGNPIIATQFNSISPENVLKWGSVHPQADGYNFGPADRYVAFGEKYKMFIVGHCLVWHSQTPRWVFENDQGQPLTREALLGRMRDHIRTVVGRYKGRIGGWDVVNEALNEDGTMRPSPWYRIIGEDYLLKAFQFAHEADPQAELYYNDYSLENEAKRQGAVELVRKLKAGGAAISGVGLQGHNKMDWPTARQEAETIEAFSALGVRVHVTELDVDVLPRTTRQNTADIAATAAGSAASNPYANGLPEEVQQALARRYAELFEVFVQHRSVIGRVTFWGVTDGDSWLNNFPTRGRTNYPLLFDRAGKPKPAFDAVLRTAKIASAQPLAVVVDVTRTGQPITKLMFGGFMEPATTQVWAEMLSDRKFFNEINSKPAPAAVSGGFGRRGPQRRWMPVGADDFVTMDRKNAYTGEWSPLIRLEAATPHGISQSGISLRAGRGYTGRIVLAGSAGSKVKVSLVWGPNPEDRQTITIAVPGANYTNFPLQLTAKADTNEGRFEIAATGSGSLHIGATSLMPADNVSGFKAANLRLLKEQGIGIARWPGGNFVSAYDWRDGIGDADKRPPRRELAWNGMESNDMGIDDFMTFCRLLGAEPYIAVNAGLGDAHSAAEEVEYVNGPATSRLGKLRAANGHPAPYGVRIWGIGNEMYGPWQWGHMSVTQYPQKHNLIVRAMRRVDPAIRVIASSATPEELSWTYIENRQLGTFPGREQVADRVPFGFGTKYDWTGALLKDSADYIDFLGEHFYGYPNLMIDEATQQFVEANDPLADRVRRMSNKVEMKFEAWEEYLKRMPFLKDRNIKFAFDEWAPRNRSVNPPGNAPAVVNPMLNPITNALVYHEFFRHSDMVGLGVATGGMGTLAADAYGDAIGFRMEGLVMKILHDHFAGAVPVAVNGNSPQHAVKGTIWVDLPARPSGSPTYPLDVVAALSADRKKLAISVVNPTETAKEIDLSITGAHPSGAARLWQLTAPAGTSPPPSAPGRGGFSGPPASMAESSLPQAPGRLSLPATSISVYEFDIR